MYYIAHLKWLHLNERGLICVIGIYHLLSMKLLLAWVLLALGDLLRLNLGYWYQSDLPVVRIDKVAVLLLL